MSSTSREKSEYEQRAHRRECTGLVSTLYRIIVSHYGPLRYKELTPLLDGFSTLEAFLGPKTNLLVDLLSLIHCSDGNLTI
jgi:hypothetical protein